MFKVKKIKTIMSSVERRSRVPTIFETFVKGKTTILDTFVKGKTTIFEQFVKGKK